MAALAAVLAGGAVPLVAPGPAAATSWSVSLSASATELEVGSSVTLTATANQSVTGTGHYIDIFDQTTGTGVGYCSVGSTCDVVFSDAQPVSHTFVAYVDADTVFRYPPCCVQATSNTVTVSWHTRATAAFDVEFAVSGSLSQFPCSAGCATTFTGTGTGSGTAHADAAGVEYSATFTVPAATVTGSARYTEPDPPLCPAIGSAAGTVTLAGAAVGTVARTTTPIGVGSVTDVTFTLDFTYQRVGGTSLVVVTGGRAVIAYAFASTSGYFVSEVAGAGPGLFEVDPFLAVSRCGAPGSVPFTVVGDVALGLM